MELIISHSNCDFDSFASMVAASLLYPEAKICMVGSPETNLKLFLNDNEYRFNLIKEKNVNPLEITKLIILDNRDPKRMGKIGQYLIDIQDKQPKTKKPVIICYDHHPDTEDDIISDYTHTELTGACTTILLSFINRCGIQLTPFQASVFALGIYEDTGNFLNVNTTHKDLAAASFLFTVGASLDFIKSYLPKDFTSQQLAIINQMISNCETIILKGITVSFIQIKIELSGFHDDLAWLLQTVKASRNLKLVFCFAVRRNKLHIIARNDYDFIHLDKIMYNLGGGGHKSAGFASMDVKDGDKREYLHHKKNEIINQLEQQILKYGIVANIMTSPADTVSPDTPIHAARNLLLNNNYSTVLVAINNEVVGILTKKDIGKAIHHNMGSLHVENCMSVNVITVREDESVYNAYKMLIDYGIGRLPVIDDKGQLAGIITRSDLLIHHYQFITARKIDTTDFDNVKGIMHKNIDKKIIEQLKQAGHIADILRMNAYVVGGFVRDLILQQPNYDLDIVVEGDGLVFAQEYCRKFGRHIKTFPKFGTAFVTQKNGKSIDISTARTEHYPTVGCLPEVRFSRIQNDLFRRDFTINSLAIQINPNVFGRLYDFYGGRRDLKLGYIRVLNNFSFMEDPIRILRAIRFEQRFGFIIDEKTTYLLRKSLQLLSLKNVSPERIKAELIYSCKKGPVDKFFSRLEELEILKQINRNISFTSHNKIICQRLSEIIIWFQNSFPKENIDEWICYHLALINGLSLRIKNKFARSFKYSSKFIESVIKTDYICRNILPSLVHYIDEGEIAIELKKLNMESILFIVALCENKNIKDNIIRYITINRFIKTELDGNDLMKIGLQQGKDVGIVLKELLKGKINQKFKDSKDEIEYVKHFICENDRVN